MSKAESDFEPTGCATATSTGPTVNYVVTNCMAQYGVRTFSGKAILTLSENDGPLTLNDSSSELIADDRPYVVDFSAVPTQSSFTESSRGGFGRSA